MLDEKQFDDLREIFPTLLLFGDPAQLAPVGQSGEMVFDQLKGARKLELHRIHRQAAGNPILDLAHALSDDSLGFEAFERMVEDAARADDRVVMAPRVDADMMARSPVLVWRNVTRVRLIQAFRSAYGAPADALLPGEPLICDGIELPLKHRKKRIDLEARGLIKGAQVIYLGLGRKPGFSRLHVIGAEDPQISRRLDHQDRVSRPGRAVHPLCRPHGGGVSARRGGDDPQGARVAVAGRAGFCARSVRGRQGGRVEAGLPLWKRLAYVAITRAQERSVLGHAQQAGAADA